MDSTDKPYPDFSLDAFYAELDAGSPEIYTGPGARIMREIIDNDPRGRTRSALEAVLEERVEDGTLVQVSVYRGSSRILRAWVSSTVYDAWKAKQTGEKR